MKNLIKVLGIVAIVAVIGFSMACGGGDGGGGGNKVLTGTITINPSTDVTVNTELIATYSGSENVSFQWKKDGSAIGTASTTNPNNYTPTAAGSYTVTVSATGYNSKTSDAVTVLSDLSGTITVSPSTGVITGTKLTATYSGSETVSYKWKYGEYDVGTGSNEYTPTMGGSYTVTVSATGFNSKTSDAVTVKGWRSINSNFGSNSIYAIAYDNNTFVVAGNNRYMATSTDGITWILREGTSGSYISDYYNAITCGNGTFVICSVKGGIATSTDGTTWTAVSKSPFESSAYSLNAIAFGNNTFVAVGDWVAIVNGGSIIATSTDGATWTALSDSTNTKNGIKAIAYGNSKFVAVGNSGKMATSTDSTTWTAVTDSTFGTSGIYAIAYGNGKFVAGGNSGKVATSDDGVTWTALAISSFDTSDVKVIAYGNNKFVAGGTSGKMAYLSDN